MSPAPQNSSSRPLRVLIVAGEVSGDMHASALMRAMRGQHAGPIEFRGVGGDTMAAEGAQILFHTDRTAVVGLWDVLRNIRFFTHMMRVMVRELETWKPDLVLTVDYPGFNMRFAKRAHARGFKTAHYICPKVWAWNQARIPKMARDLDHLITIFPFETACFEGTGLRVTFAGNPLVDRTRETFAEPETPLPWHGQHHIALLPGSRTREITGIFPDMLAAAVLLEKELAGDCSFLVPTATAAMRQLAEAVAAQSPCRPARLIFVDGQARQTLRQAHVAAVASGTATLEACLMRCPTALVYRSPGLNLALRFAHIRYLGLANIIAGRTVMPELLQQHFTPAALAARLKRYLTDPAERAKVLADYEAVATALGSGDSAARAAKAVLATL
jgi:lipid-A-disaccharide synthase